MCIVRTSTLLHMQYIVMKAGPTFCMASCVCYAVILRRTAHQAADTAFSFLVESDLTAAINERAIYSSALPGCFISLIMFNITTIGYNTATKTHKFNNYKHL